MPIIRVEILKTIDETEMQKKRKKRKQNKDRNQQGEQKL